MHVEVEGGGASSVAMSSVWYTLTAVVSHSGSSTDSGHYFCFARDGDGAWWLFNDAKVTATSEDKVLSAEAYVLLYERVGTATPCGDRRGEE